MSFSGLSLKVVRWLWTRQDLWVIGQMARPVSCIRTARTVRPIEAILIFLAIVFKFRVLHFLLQYHNCSAKIIE